MGLLRLIGQLLAGKSVSYSTTTSSFTGTKTDSRLPTPVRGEAATALDARFVVDGVERERQMRFTRYTIDPADRPKWAAAFVPIPIADVPPRPDRAPWWIDDAALAGATLHDAGEALAPAARGFVALAADGASAYVYTQREVLVR